MSNRRLEEINIVVIPGTSLTIIVPDQTFVDYAVYTLCIGQILPPRTGAEAVFISTNATVPVVYPALDRAGNTLRAGKLRGKHRYRIVYGSDTPHFLFFDGLCCMQYSATASLISNETPPPLPPA